MKKYNFKSIIAALVCACSLGFQAKATNYVINGSATNVPGGATAAITSITATGSSPTAYYYSGTTDSVSVTSGVAATFSFAVSISNSNNLKQGDSIIIPVSVQPDGHFPSSSFTLSIGYSTQPDGNFTVSWNSSRSAIILIATKNLNAGAATENVTATTTLNSTGDTPAQLATAGTTFTVDGKNYSITSKTANLTPATSCGTSIYNTTAQGSTSGYLAYNISCLYNQFLTGTAVNNLTGVDVKSDFIEVINIPANSAIQSIAWRNSSTYPYINNVMPSNSQVSTANLGYWNTPQTFNSVTVPAGDTTMADLESYLTQPGDRAIIQNSDGSYTLAVNWGPLVGAAFNEYPSDAVSNISPNATSLPTDPNAQALVQNTINAGLSALINRIAFNITMANPYVPDTIRGVTQTDNIGLSSSSGIYTSLALTSGGSTGQTVVVGNYVNLSGTPIQAAVPTAWGDYGNSVMSPAPPETIPYNGTTYTLVQDLTIADTVHVTNSSGVSVPILQAGTVHTTSYNTPYPQTGVQNVYYVYAPATTSLPITGLQLTAQPKGNTVALSWGTLTEINSKNFTVQRSSDGGKTWVTITTQPTKAINGNSSVPLAYTAQDIVLQSGSYEYRIIETDVDGSTTVSNVATVTISTNGSAVYPNPTKGLLNVVLPASASSATYRMISSDGKIVLTGTMNNAGNHGTIEVAGIASGVYFLQVDINNTMQTYEVQIQQ